MAAEGQARFQAARRVFLAAGEREGAELEAYLAHECGADDELRREVRELLQEARAGDRRLEQPAAAALLGTQVGGRMPETIGEFRILGVLGSGGAGIVYEAEQQHPRRPVALKLIRSPFASIEERRRFEQEGQALAWLSHPGIAAVHATGVADAGFGPQPYLAMELVRGERLDEHVQRQRLSVPERLELVARVCDAVHHAHEKGVIHRDLKPSNILVDAVGQPKVLDFGVARITNSDLEATTRRTGVGEILGTLAYMSPEQVRADPTQIDRRVDVYALGVIAYELVAGRRPLDVASTALPAAIQTIVNDEPTHLGALDRRLRGEIETIVHKALAKEKERRYATAAELAADLRRHLANEPILARPTSRAYQLRKFARRNRPLVGGVAAVFLVLLAGAVTSTVLYFEKEEQRAAAVERGEALETALTAAQANLDRALEAEQRARVETKRAATEADTAEAVIDYLVTLFEHASPEHGDTHQVTALDMLDRGIERVQGQFLDRPAIRARLLNVFGQINNWLQRYERSRPILEEALTLVAQVSGEDSAEYADTLERLANVNLESGDVARAEAMQRQVLELRARHLGTDHPLYTDALNNLANSCTARGAYDEAEALFQEARATRVAQHGEDHPEVAALDYGLATVYSYQGRGEEAVAAFERALAGLRAGYGERHWRTLMARIALADELGRTDPAAAREHARQGYEGLRSLFGDDNLMTSRALKIYATTLSDSRDFEGAVAVLEEVLAGLETVEGGLFDRALLLSLLAENLYELGRLDEAEALYLESLELHGRLGGQARDIVLTTRHNLSVLYQQAGRLDEALELELDVLSERERFLGDSHPDSCGSLNNLAAIYAAMERPEQEEAVRRRKLAALERDLGADSSEARGARRELAAFLEGSDRADEARRLLGRDP
ncbi:MAG TPA: serine/threonine-protein kinase [Planctomycetota bacterium]